MAASKWSNPNLKDKYHEPMQGKVYGEMHGDFTVLVCSHIYEKLRGPLSRSLFINLQIALEAIGHRTKWIKK